MKYCWIICCVFIVCNLFFTCRSSLRQIIEKRIGLETFTEKLSQVPKNESYTKAAKKPHVSYKQSSEVTFDYEFTRIFKALEGKTERMERIERERSIAMLFKMQFTFK